MSLLLTLLVIFGMMFAYVVYQSKDDKGDINLYFKRFKILLLNIFKYLKDVGVDAAVKFKKINWSDVSVKEDL